MKADTSPNTLSVHDKEKVVNSPKHNQTKGEQQAIYRFIDSATEGLILFDSKLNILRANSAAFKLCNQENANAKDLSVVDLFSGLEGLRMSERFLDVIDTGNPYSSDYMLSDSQPEVRHLHVKAFKVDDGLGVILEDITERKRVENLIIRAKKEWERTFDTMPDLVAITDDRHRITRLNKAMASHLGLTPAQAIGLTCYKYVHGTEEPPPFCPHSQMLKDKRAYVKDLYSEKLGGHFTVSISPIFDKNGRFIGSVHVFRDITERKRMEEELLKNEAILRKAQEQARVGSWEWDLNNNIFHVSQEMCRIYGLPENEPLHDVKSLITKYIHPDDRAKLEKAVNAPTTKGVEREFIFRIVRPDGDIRWVASSRAEVIRFTPDNKPAVIAGIIQDITDHVQRQEERRMLETQLMQSEKMASIGQLAAGVAHEINNPIAFVNSNLTVLTDYQNDIMALMERFRKLIADLIKFDVRTSLPASINEQLDKIEDFEKKVDIDFVTGDVIALIRESKEGVERIKKIVIDLKDFAHPGDDELKTVDINKGIESTLNVVWNELKYKAEVKKDYGKIPLVAGYPQKLNQVFMNLLVNAAQAIETTGEIRISTRAVDGRVEVIISDTGVGIPEENISKIFDPFFTTKEVGAGTGLGLNMAYNIIKKHNGTIDVNSTVGAGTTFTIRIPVN